MIRKLVFLLVTLPIALILVAFIVANRHAVAVSFDPFNATEPAYALSMPLFVLVFGVLLLGVFLGGVATWFSQGQFRKEARTQRFEADKAKRDAEELKTALRGADAGPALPAPQTRS